MHRFKSYFVLMLCCFCINHSCDGSLYLDSFWSLVKVDYRSSLSAVIGRWWRGSLRPTVASNDPQSVQGLSKFKAQTSMPTYLAFPLPFLFASSCGHCTKHLSTTLLSMVPLKLIFFTLAQDST